MRAGEGPSNWEKKHSATKRYSGCGESDEESWSAAGFTEKGSNLERSRMPPTEALKGKH